MERHKEIYLVLQLCDIEEREMEPLDLGDVEKGTSLTKQVVDENLEVYKSNIDFDL